MFKNIRLERFKQFQDTTIELTPFCILMGENNSGKTSVLQAIRMAMQALHESEHIKQDKGIKKLYMAGFSGLSSDSMPSLFYGRKIGSTSSKGGGGLQITLESEHSGAYSMHFRNMWKQLHVSINNSLGFKYKNDFLPTYISGYVGLNDFEERFTTIALNERASSGKVSDIVRNVLLDIKTKTPSKYELLKKLMKHEFGFDISTINFDTDKDRYLEANYYELCDDKKVELNFSSSGSGLLQILQILVVIFRYCPEESKVVLIDEPDAHLHSDLQVRFADLLRTVQQSLDIQIILSTHSISIIRDASPFEVVPISHKMPINKGFETLYEVQSEIGTRLDSYEIGKAVLSGKIAFFEDADISVLKFMASSLGKNCFDGIKSIPYVCGKGKDDKVPYELNAYLKHICNRDIEIHVIRDSDGLPENTKNDLIQYAQNKNVKLHILNYYEVENYILVPELIYKTLCANNSEKLKEIPSISVITEKIKTALLDTIRLGAYDYSGVVASNLFCTKNKLLGEHYSPDQSKSEALSLLKDREKLDDLNSLCKYGLGKEALKIINSWINNDLKLKFGYKLLYKHMTKESVPEEIITILDSLKSEVDSFGISEQSSRFEILSNYSDNNYVEQFSLD